MKKLLLTLILLFFITCHLFSIDKDVYSSGWTIVNAGTTQGLRSVYFVNQNTGWVVGWGNTVIKTTNGGVNWVFQSANGDFQSVYFLNEFTGWIVGGGNATYKTTNGGNNWISKNLPPGTYLELIVKFVDAYTGYICGYDGLVLKSTDGGESWSKKYSGVTYNLTGIDFVNSLTGWVTGDYGTIKKTTDGGESWIAQISGTTANLGKMDFINTNYGWISGYGGIVLRTTNGGNNWIKVQTPVNSWLTSVYFFDKYNGYAAGGDYNNTRCDILKTNNGGVTWCRQQVPSNCWLGLIFFVNRNRGWAVGHNGTILKYSCGCDNESFQNLFTDSKLTSEFSLSQNYPNPFNPVTKIRFDIPASINSSIISLKVYDNAGREVAVLVNDILSPGAHEVIFEGSKFASGTYFYTLTAGDFKETKRMILIK